MLNSVGLSEEEVEEILASSEEEMENAGKSGAHSHIHIPKGNKDDETDIDIVEEFAKLTSDEKKDVMMMLRPITFFRGIMDFFDITCEAFIGSSLETTLMAENQQQQFGAAPY